MDKYSMDFCFVPSPSGSDDSGLGLSPRSVNSALESPNYVISNVTGFREKEEQRFGSWGNDFNNSKGNFIATDLVPQSILVPNIATNFLKDQTRKTNKGQRKRNTAVEHSEKLKKCLEPKTGNKKPRQTSSKKKNKMERNRSHDARMKAYPGVRPKTVREQLQALRESKNLSSSHQPPQHQQQQQQRPQQQRQTQNFNPVYSFQPQLNPISYQTPNLTQAPEVPSDMLSCFGDADIPQMSPVLVNSILNESEPQSPCFSTQSTCYSTPYTPDYQSSSISGFSPSNSPASSFTPVLSDFTTIDNMGTFSCENTGIYTNLPMANDPIYSTCQTTLNQPTYLENDNIWDCVLKGDNIQLENLLTSQFFDQAQINSRDEYGMTPLLYAAKSGNINGINILLNFGADATMTSQQEGNVFHVAADNANTIQHLLHHLQPQIGNKLINEIKLGGHTPLHVATEKGNPVSVTSLLSRGAPLNIQEHQNGWTPLHIAVKKCDIAVLQRLLGHIANFRGTSFYNEVINQTTCNENTALHFAAEQQTVKESDKIIKEKIIKLLLDSGADVCKKNNENRTPFNLLPQGHSHLHEILRPNRRRTSSVSNLVPGSFPENFESLPVTLSGDRILTRSFYSE